MPRFNAIFPSTKEADRFIHQLGRSELEVFLSSQYEKSEGTEVRFRAQLRNFSTEHDEQLARGEVKALVRRFNGRLIPMTERQEIEEMVDGLTGDVSQEEARGRKQPVQSIKEIQKVILGMRELATKRLPASIAAAKEYAASVGGYEDTILELESLEGTIWDDEYMRIFDMLVEEVETLVATALFDMRKGTRSD